ncbi:hypothetical protein Phpb_02670 [Photorhabdus namnaonensis]|uniref:Uncharacterized protein n=2 Tax=Photorhabdus namnaonensis TaxID=1851568 RepID=A0A1B8YGH2_9GAMM|nr:hypothetical protein Phpb_02670 [Photorhabdus namnaonensis]
MDDDAIARREREYNLYISNKIKRCKLCNNELTYEEKFYYTNKICNQCRLSQGVGIHPEGQVSIDAVNERIERHCDMIKEAERRYFDELRSKK